MTNLGLADRQNKSTEEQCISHATVLKAFAIIAVAGFLLRIFYAGYLYEDDGLWFTAAEEILRGKALYSGIYFDKPPALPLLYAGLFKLFGAHILTIRLFTIGYSLVVSAVLYKFGSWLYNKRAGLIAAAFFTFFSTTAASGHVQGFDTDFLMILPYTAAAYLLARASLDGRKWLAVGGGALVGLAVQVNPKGVFDLVFFAALLVMAGVRLDRGGTIAPKIRRSVGGGRLATLLRLFLFALGGFITGSLPFIAYLAATHSLARYWLDVWDWGARYAAYNSAAGVISSGLRVSVGYFALNSTLLITLLLVVVSIVKQARHFQTNQNPGSNSSGLLTRRVFVSDVTLLMWLAISYAGVAVGGRFYSHYFFQILPSLSLIGARGVIMISSDEAILGKRARLAVIVLLVMAFMVSAVRFHTRTITLAGDWLRGKKSEATATWFHERLNQEEHMVAAQVRGLPDGAEEDLGAEGIRKDAPGAGASEGAADYLFVWGYRPEVYYWSGLLPASRYLSAQPLTGVPADAQYLNGERRSILDESSTASARAQLIRDLNETQPKYIIDELGFFNGELAILQYPELKEYMSGYKPLGSTGRFLVYIRRDLTLKNLSRKPTTRP